MARGLGVEKNTILASIVLLIAANVSELWQSQVSGWVAAALLAGLLLVIARKGNLSYEDIGLSRKAIRGGLVWGLAAAACITLVMIVAFAIDHKLFVDSRYHNQLGGALWEALLVIPLHTVLIEELAFRGVLLASLKRVAGLTKAIVVSSLLFGLWHIVPSLHLSQSSDTLSSSTVGGSGIEQALVILGVVAVTTAAGIGFCELRRRSGSLLAPIMAHWAINGVAVLLAALAWAK